MISQLVLKRHLYLLRLLRVLLISLLVLLLILRTLRVPCICSLGFAEFFRYDELSSIAPVHLRFFS